MSRLLVLSFTHVVVFLMGLALGIYLLPVLTQGEAVSSEHIAQVETSAQYSGVFDRNRIDSDALHWGEGEFFINDNEFAFRGELAPGPDYKLYLIPKYVETEDEFMAMKAQALHVGAIDRFDGFTLSLPPGVDLSQYEAAIIWCERFSQFITSGHLKS
ncbi:DM13 domain-containing protein [Ferrimonas aestuarii]|uniref:DM13 domain-containing protein n=1 Tax=Ferrimonas aestuarii TaxID=2569539 RepID=A0A4V5NVS2_9GAMM|nr:DM13 domain-containing protein [Ferrimonas aestuarii]TKB51672.1 hypothetical protein FCL42_17685 [Ferrimonas aestuarii]